MVLNYADKYYLWSQIAILLDFNEHALYEIRKELINSKFYKNNVTSILGDFASEEVLYQLFLKYKIDIIFHAAAYVVPLVEENPLQRIYIQLEHIIL